MFYIKLGILLIGFIQAGLLPYFIQKALSTRKPRFRQANA